MKPVCGNCGRSHTLLFVLEASPKNAIFRLPELRLCPDCYRKPLFAQERIN